MSVAIRDGGAEAAPGAGRLLAAAARAALSAADRDANLAVDFFLPAGGRPSDAARAGMSRLFDQLVGGIEADLRAALGPRIEEQWPAAAAALASPRVPIALPILDRAGLLRDAGLIAFLAGRAATYRMVAGLRPVAEMGNDPVAGTGQAADLLAADRALMLAEARRTDAAYEPAIDQRDVPAELFHRLVWRIAAALRDYLVRLHDVPAALADRLISDIGRAIADAHDEGETIDAAAIRLARAFAEQGGIEDRRLLDAWTRGRVELVAALLAPLGGIPYDHALAALRDAAPDRLALLLKASGVGRDAALAILVQHAAINGVGEPRLIDCVDDFSVLEPAAAREAVEAWRLDEGYRQALAALAERSAA